MGESKKTFQIRHTGERRYPVFEISVGEIKNLLDSGFRRNDESKENEFQLPFLGLRAFYERIKILLFLEKIWIFSFKMLIYD